MMKPPMTQKKKLIEVALPLEAINLASAREKSIRHGHPSTLHLWWARRPLAAARAVIFAQMVDDPSGHPDIFRTEKAQEKERQRLFRIIEHLVKWESTIDETVLQQARDAIWQSWRHTCVENVDHPMAKELFNRYKLPIFHDPFAGGGAIPLEAQRLGLESYGSDLNPVAVLINKAMIEIPPRFAGTPPVNPEWVAKRDDEKVLTQWQGARGLAEDLRFYGLWIRNEASKRIGHLYPKVEVTESMVDDRPDLKKYFKQQLTVVAWLWARTVKSPNPAFNDVDVPLVSSFILSPMAGKETYVEPVIEGRGYRFEVRVGKAPDSAKSGTKLSRGANFRCVLSDIPIPSAHIYEEAVAGRMGSRLMAIVAEGERGRIYLSPTSAMESIGLTATPEWKPDVAMPGNPRWFSPPLYGLKTYGDLFTPRQLVALTTFADLVGQAKDRIKRDAIAAGTFDRATVGGAEDSASAYANAVATYLGFLVSKLADKGSSLCTWDSGPSSNKTASGRSARVATVRVTFGRQALPMTWDYAEVNFFSDSVGSIDTVLKTLSAPLAYFPRSPPDGHASQADAQLQSMSGGAVISTDPPYYDNIGYADLSDFFYVWLRRCLKVVYPELFATVAVPKAEELVATPYRHGGKKSAETFFLDGMTRAMHRLTEQAHPAFPVTIYYAFKQAESDGADGTTNTGWDTFLAAVIKAGFAISGTWPVRTEMGNRMIGSGTNALASSIVLVCRKIEGLAPTTTRREFHAELKAELPKALAHLQAGNIAPVDLAQAAIGPGMAIYTRYAQVLNAEGESLSVRAALALINQTLDDALTEQEGDFDPDTRWALTWFEQSGFLEGEYGIAEQLSKSKNTSVGGLVNAGILLSKAGKVRLLKPAELPSDWNPATDGRLTVWEIVHQMIRALESGGESSAASLVAKLGGRADTARELCYRLYMLCERKKRTAEAISYNGLVQSWPEISRLAGSASATQDRPDTNDMFAKE
jgi:putative DNA methylase